MFHEIYNREKYNQLIIQKPSRRSVYKKIIISLDNRITCKPSKTSVYSRKKAVPKMEPSGNLTLMG